MINLLLGAPGGGKSYEATAFHILPAIKAGRKVVTNLPLDLAAWAQLDPDYPALIEIRTATLAEEPAEPETRPARFVFGRPVGTPVAVDFCNRAFSHPEDYQDPWRHPTTEVGVLYVVDECHMALPYGCTDRAVEEWYSMHWHHNVDVLLITQSYGKVSKSIVDLVQMVYRVRKAVAFGSMNKYIRKVQDGIKGDVVNTSIREYKKKYQELYRSHTKGRAVEEMTANDIVPIWRRWPFIGALLCFILFGFFVTMILTKKPPDPSQQANASGDVKTGIATTAAPAPTAAASASAPASNVIQVGKAKEEDPFAGRGLHLVGEISKGGKRNAVFSISQNGQHVHYVKAEDLESAGYTVSMTGACSAVLTWQTVKRGVICDLPRVGPSVGGGVTSGGST